MFESVIFGTVQGIAEWLPISSEGLIALLHVWLIGGEVSATDIIRFSLFLHLGTFFAAFIYLRRDVWNILTSLFWHTPDEWTRATTRFLIVSTGISGLVGISIFYGLGELAELFEARAKGVMALVGVMLLATGWIQIRKQKFERSTSDVGHPAHSALRSGKDATIYDGILLGFAQGLSVIPGISRSGITVAVLLFRRFDDVESLRLSFLMSLPIVLAGNIFLNAQFFEIKSAILIALAASFIFGLLTIHALLRLARRVNFGWFVLGFGGLVVFSVLLF